MGDPDATLEVSIMIMMAIAEPHGQITMLQKIMQIVQDQTHLQQLLAYPNIGALYNDLDDTFKDIVIA